jgi:hypothetical protein
VEETRLEGINVGLQYLKPLDRFLDCASDESCDRLPRRGP